MKTLPDKHTLKSALYALNKLDGAEAHIKHIELYIRQQEDELKRLRAKSTGSYQVAGIGSRQANSNEKNINTESFKILNATNDQIDDTDDIIDDQSPKQTTILVVEDDISIGIMIKAIAESDGFVALIAETGKAGLALAEEYIPDLIICDVHLPGMHGLEVVKTIKAHSELKDIPILMLTADIFKAEESFEMGVSEYILKPIRKNQLLGYINKYISTDK